MPLFLASPLHSRFPDNLMLEIVHSKLSASHKPHPSPPLAQNIGDHMAVARDPHERAESYSLVDLSLSAKGRAQLSRVLQYARSSYGPICMRQRQQLQR